MIPYATQWITQSEIDEVTEVLKSGWLSPGPNLEKFEASVAEYCGARYAVAVSSGTAALHTAVYAAGISKGDEGITSTLSFVASGNALIFNGATPRLCDIDEVSYNIDIKCLERLVSEKTKVIIPVHFSGLPCNMEAIKRIADKNDIVIIEDAAHALGASYGSFKVGACDHSDMVCFSFHPVKNITTGEGGMILTNNKTYYKRLMKFRNHGITKNPEELSCCEGPWYYEMQDLGYNYRMTNIQAAIGLKQMERLPGFIKRRREIAEQYNQAFCQLDGLTPPSEPDNMRSCYHLYVIKLNLERLKHNRKQIFETLRKQDLGVQVHYIPIHYHPYYQRTYDLKKGDCPRAENVYNRIISLPMFPKMTDEEVKKVVEIVTRTVLEASK